MYWYAVLRTPRDREQRSSSRERRTGKPSFFALKSDIVDGETAPASAEVEAESAPRHRWPPCTSLPRPCCPCSAAPLAPLVSGPGRGAHLLRLLLFWCRGACGTASFPEHRQHAEQRAHAGGPSRQV